LTSVIQQRASSTREMIQVFSDAALLTEALAFETALAAASAAEGLLTAAEAAAIKEACAGPLDPAVLAERAAHAGTLPIPLLAMLRERMAETNPAAAAKLHQGATSQDVLDTALMRQAKAGLALIERDLAPLLSNLETLAQIHAATPMLGRTLLQGAQPITFGLKAAQWRLGVQSAAARLRGEADAALALQFGGAAGTRAGLGGRGGAIAERLAKALALANPPAPWHSRRDKIAALGNALALLIGALAKIARDVSLLAQNEIGELFEPSVPGRGGSSAMPHKRNPTGCQVVLSAQVRAPGLAASLLAAALAQEHERGLGGWQAEAPLLADLFLLTHGAVQAMGAVLGGLDVRPAAMKRNLDASGAGADTGEATALVARILSEEKAR
jgi:3-carboxy-cis,cis-muconate cycloisomerase